MFRALRGLLAASAFGQTGSMTIDPTLYAKLPYDAQKDLAPVARWPRLPW